VKLGYNLSTLQVNINFKTQGDFVGAIVANSHLSRNGEGSIALKKSK
jgi:hypothetical protein